MSGLFKKPLTLDQASAAAVSLRADVINQSDPAKAGGMVPISDSLSYAIGTLSRRVRDFGFIVNVPAGNADATTAINAQILKAFQSMSNILTANEIYSVSVLLEQGKDYSVLGTILIPNGIVLNLNGSRLMGPNGGAGTVAYSAGSHHMIRSAQWTGSAIASNAAAIDEITWRVIGAGVINGTIQNTNCALDLTNFQEQCYVDGLRFGNVSAPMRLKNCFYLRIGAAVPIIIRNSANIAGQPAILLHGAAAHDMFFDVRIVGAGIGYEITATNSFSVEIRGSMEEGYAINSIGIRSNGAYCQSWTIHAYMEGVRVGITTINNGFFFACNFAPAYFSSTEYAMLAQTSSFRACTLDCASIPDEGAGVRNLVDLQAANNDVRFRVPSKTRNTALGVQPFPTNFLLGPGCVTEAASVWVQNSNALEMLGIGDGALVNKNKLVQLPFEGRQITTVQNEVPFCTLTVTSNSITLDSLIVADLSDVCLVNITISDFNGTYIFNGWIFGASVYLLNAPGKIITVSSVGGYKRLVFGGLNTNSGASYSISGVFRHV